jgi:hypothetical protein
VQKLNHPLALDLVLMALAPFASKVGLLALVLDQKALQVVLLALLGAVLVQDALLQLN